MVIVLWLRRGHSESQRVLSKATKRWGQEVFVSLFSRVVAQCVSAGLVEGSKIHLDSSLVDADASLNSVRELDAASLAQIRKACLQETQKLDEVEHPKNQTDEDQKPNPPGPDSPKTTNEKFQSSTDPEATLTRQQGLRARPRYKNHRVVDDAQGIVTALKTTTGIVNEAHELMGLIDQHQVNAGVQPKPSLPTANMGPSKTTSPVRSASYARIWPIYRPAALGVGSGMRSIRNRSSSTEPRVTPICARLVN